MSTAPSRSFARAADATRDERATEAELDERIGRLNRDSPPSFRAASGPVRRLGPIAADRHAAPAPGVALRAIEEQQRAGRARARPDQPEILMADQVRRRFGDRLEQLPRALPTA